MASWTCLRHCRGFGLPQKQRLRPRCHAQVAVLPTLERSAAALWRRSALPQLGAPVDDRCVQFNDPNTPDLQSRLPPALSVLSHTLRKFRDCQVTLGTTNALPFIPVREQPAKGETR